MLQVAPKAVSPLPSSYKIFPFFDNTGIQLAITYPVAPRYMRIQFRYSKGTVRSFTYQMFASIPSSPFCHVAAGYRVVRRWLALQPGDSTLLFCYLPSSLTRAAFSPQDTHMTAALRSAVVRSYPNEQHIMRLNLSAISSHSLRIFACLCLQTAGWSHDDISHQLRWDSDVVQYYIRHSLVQVNAVIASILTSALVKTPLAIPRLKTE